MKNFPSNYLGISERAKLIIISETPEKGRFSWLDERTGVPRNTWQSFFKSAKAVPGGEMIQALARLFPRYAFWLASGLTDLEYGHAQSKHAMAKCFPEDNSREERKRFDDYFAHCMEMQMRVYDAESQNYSKTELVEANNNLKRLARLRKIELNMLSADENGLEIPENQHKNV